MIHAYRLTYPFSAYGPPQLWEWEQPFIDALVLNARTFNQRVVQRYFDDWGALAQDNTRIWQTYYEPKPLSELYTGWQEMLAEHRQMWDQTHLIVRTNIKMWQPNSLTRS